MEGKRFWYYNEAHLKRLQLPSFPSPPSTTEESTIQPPTTTTEQPQTVLQVIPPDNYFKSPPSLSPSSTKSKQNEPELITEVFERQILTPTVVIPPEYFTFNPSSDASDSDFADDGKNPKDFL